ncbi:glucan biosynthesis protein [Elioraea sp.]|uniref:glucan biosynthesis protein n=1 Tax=Elioraea sp. TaxID=2185103 RepID=UPI0025C19FFC|nr:glucan biosynthesis protein [Elioraea sp.]
MLRRHVMMGGIAAASLSASSPTLVGTAQAEGQPSDADGFSAEQVAMRARHLAAKPYVAPDNALPPSLRDLSYDQYRTIRFDRSQAPWRSEGLPFQLQPFHRGFLYRDRVALHDVDHGVARPLRFGSRQFSYGEKIRPVADEDLGYAGTRVLTRLNRTDHYDEVVAFLGASYFRAVARGHVYGISARGLALGTADPKGEEFPWFRSFWFERPDPEAETLVVHALLDSQSVAGAYRFTVRPGAVTTMDVDARLYPRRNLISAGIAPLTSMYLHSPNDRGGADDYRPAVHDSDGLLVLTARGERLWRPLTNPRTLQVSGFADRDPTGFGLMQRRRFFTDFHDLESAFHRRPSLWVEPLSPFGEGEVQLIEIPTPNEINDNIVAFWRPKAPLPAGGETRLQYRLHWCSEPPIGPTVAAFTGTRVGAGSNARMRRFVLDVDGRALAERQGAPRPVLDAWASAGTIHHATIHPNIETGGLRVAFEFASGGAPMAELGVRLLHDGAPLTETWLYRWSA